MSRAIQHNGSEIVNAIKEAKYITYFRSDTTIDDEEESTADDGWKQASGPGKKWSNVVNGTSTPKAKSEKSSVKDNKVAYLLFYQKI